MERKIGEIFEHEGKKLRVEESKSGNCGGCFFNGQCPLIVRKTAGECQAESRVDNKYVIFVEVQEQPHKEREVVKERRVGEVFEYEGKRLIVNEEKNGCDGCFFDGQCHKCKKDIAGNCGKYNRNDHNNVIFVDIDKEETQDEQPQLNLCEILKNCPVGTELWSDNYGIVKFVNVCTEWDTPIRVKLTNGCIARYTEEGWCDKRFPASCLLWPSRDCRDWSKFTAPWLKKERFDPKMLNPFDKVLVNHDDIWKVDFFSHICQYEPNGWCQCTGDSYYICIPYNDETKHLVGTKEEAPEYYRYWED